MWKTFTDAFYLNFVSDNRWKYLTEGLKTTLIITFFACLMGIVLGFLVGMIRSPMKRPISLKVLNAICKVYLTVIRGTPVVGAANHLLCCIGSVRVDKVIVAILAFGVNWEPMWRRYSEAASCPLIRDRWRQAAAWASTMPRPCGTSSCPRPLRQYSQPCATSLSPC